MRFSKKAFIIFVAGVLCLSLFASGASFAQDGSKSSGDETKLKITGITASSSAYPDTSPVEKLLDGDITDNSYWTSDKNNVAVTLDVGQVKMITTAKMAFYNANTQQVKFDLAVSTDKKSWTMISRDNASKQGDPGLQSFPVNYTGRYLRIIGHGNTTEKWYMYTSINEVELYGTDVTETKLKVAGISASGSAYPDTSPVEKLLDGDITDNSYWTSDKNNVTVDADMGSLQYISNTKMAFYSANAQQVKFDLEVSENGTKWYVVSKNNASKQGDTGLQTFQVGKLGRYLRIVGHGNTTEKWYMFTSINELEVYGTPATIQGEKLAVEKVTASHSADQTNSPPEKLIDGDITNNSFWTSDQNNVTVDFDLGKTCLLTETKMAFYEAMTQSVKFDLAVSEDGENWSIVSENNISKFKDTNLQSFPINKNARYLRVIGHGNTTEKWYMFTSITEVEIYGK